MHPTSHLSLFLLVTADEALISPPGRWGIGIAAAASRLSLSWELEPLTLPALLVKYGESRIRVAELKQLGITHYAPSQVNNDIDVG
ncbi:hypothetical protein F4775DRAFT_589348 [Biscogniauxia sp. FL1348]|nr:hypothetical protein F4775DRAFT_589348 [Biscogniauxia sp. FL1348]